MYALTNRQRRVLDAFESLVKDGLTPTHQAVADRAGLGRGNVTTALAALEAKGYLTKGGRERKLRPAEADGWVLVARQKIARKVLRELARELKRLAKE